MASYPAGSLVQVKGTFSDTSTNDLIDPTVVTLYTKDGAANKNVYVYGLGELEGTIDITGVSTADPSHVTATAHGFSTGDKVVITGVVGAVQANGTWTITVIDANTFSIPVNVTGVYVSGGTATGYVGGTSGFITRQSEGIYTANLDTTPLDPDNTGVWTYQYRGSGTVGQSLQASTFVVTPAAIPF